MFDKRLFICYNVYNMKQIVNIQVNKADKCNGEQSIFVSFKYNDTILNIIRSFPTRYWHKDARVWELPVKKLDELRNQLSNFDLVVEGEDKIINPIKSTTKYECVFKSKTTPFNHQIEGFNFGLIHDKWLLGDEQGLGKTKQAIDIAIAKKQELGYKHCLIICGVNGLKWNWQNEIKVHSDESGYILGQRMKRGKLVIGSTQDKIDDLERLDYIDEYFIITNVETLRNANINVLISDYCKSKDINMCVVDEIHKIKNPSSQQGKGVLKVLPEYRLAMTGTPLMNTPLDLYMILKWLGYEKHPFYAFKNHYCVMGGYGGYEIVGYKNLDELQSQLSEIMLRRLKEDVLDLPEKLYVDEYVDMTTKQTQIYKETLAQILDNIDKIQLSPNPLAELIRLRQATGYTGILSSSITESAKLDRLEELVEETVANGKKAVIFSNWTQVTTIAYERLSKLFDGVTITGETPDTERQVNVNRFQEDTNCKFILGTTGAMGTGLTLTAGTVVIFLDEPWTMANKEQAVDRCHRIGTTSNITIYTIMCKNTIDERIHDIVVKKGLISDAIVDGKIVGDKLELINYLLS